MPRRHSLPRLAGRNLTEGDVAKGLGVAGGAGMRQGELTVG